MSKRVISSTKNKIINIDLSYNKTILILYYEDGGGGVGDDYEGKSLIKKIINWCIYFI